MENIAFLFPGQGSQYVGMGKKLCEKYNIAKHTFQEADQALDFNLSKLCFEGSMEELTKTENTQPAILTMSIAVLRILIDEMGIKPAYVAGHSLGEFSALCSAGVISFSDAVRIVKQRGRFMQEAVPAGLGAMAAISGIDKAIIEKECSRVSKDDCVVVISNYNSLEQIVISGHTDAVNKVGESLKEAGARVIPLKVSAPFHSPLMQQAADRLKEELTKYSYGDFKWPVISNVTALPYTGKDKIIENLAMQIVKPVRWQESVDFMVKSGMKTAVELGPKTVLRDLMKKNAPGVKTYSFDNDEDAANIDRLLNTQKQYNGIEQGIKIITMCIAIAVSTKNQNWNEEEYQKGAVEPFMKIKSLKGSILKDARLPSEEEVKEALLLLREILSTKKVPQEEQSERFRSILEDTNTANVFSNLLNI